MTKCALNGLACVAVLASCAAPQPPASPTPELAAMEARCDTLADVDIRRVPAEPPDWSWVEPLHQRARQGERPPPQGMPIVKVAIPAAGIGAPRFDFSIWAARQPDGTWLVSKARHLAVPPPPQGPQDFDAQGRQKLDPALRGGIFSEGRLQPAAARQLDLALRSNCLARQPRVQPDPLPQKGGGELPCPPDAGSMHALEIVTQSASRRYVHHCSREWASGHIIILLESSPLSPV